MSVSPADAEHLASDVRAHYVALESSLLALLVRQIKRHLSAPDWQIRQQAERWRFERLLMAKLAISEREAKELVETAVTEAYALGRGEVPDAVNAAQTILASASLGVTAWQVLRATYPALRQAVMRAYQDAIFAGGIDPATRKQAIQAVLNALAGRGLSVPTQALTARWGVAEYAEMNTRAATGRSVVKGAVDAMAATGEDLVQISAHGGACPICRPWEGAILSISGRASEYRSLDAAMADGLFHVNCRHQAFQYERGMKIPFWEPERDRANAYQNAQKERYIERGIRYWKRREMVALTEQEARLAKAKVKLWQAKAREHVAATGTFRKYEREQI